MCLALPAKIVEVEEDGAWVVLGDSRLKASLALVPEAGIGDWVLVHAGFALATLSEAEARETWDLFGEIAAADR